MSFDYAIAPCSWGIEDPSCADNPSWRVVLDEAGKSGFKGIELGPYGYLPTDSEKLSEELQRKGLQLIAGTIFDNLTGSADSAYLIKKTENICRLLSKTAGEGCFLVLIDDVKDLRNNTAGNSGLAKRLDAHEWKKMILNIEQISRIAAEEFGVRAVVHPHAGGFIEFDDETERVVHDLPADIAGLCLDTGHLYYAGDDPAVSLLKYSERLDYVHFKDINKPVYKKAVEEGMGFFDACKLGVMCSIGRGCVDYEAVFEALSEIKYRNWITVEQERDPRDFAGTLKDVQLSFEFLNNTSKRIK